MYLKRVSSLIVIFTFLLSACSSKNTPSASSTNPTAGNGLTVQNTSTSEAIIPTNTPEPSATPTTEPTATFTPELTPTDIPTNSTMLIAAVPACTNRATLVRHLSFADGSKITSGFFFGKSWRIQNTGTCTWTTAYAFVFASGEQMNAPAETPLPSNVAPGETIDIQIKMKSPDVANTYTGDWMLRDPNGTLFGTGDMADQPIGIKIIVIYHSTEDKFPAPECG